MKFYKNFNKYLQEIDIDFSKFKIQDTLEPNIWRDNVINFLIKENLIKIATDFFETLVIDAEIEDIIITGSSASYNWHSLSDIDLHILIEFSTIDAIPEVTKGFFDAKRSLWNKNHDIMIVGHEVEIYVQNTEEEHYSNGMYSLLKDRWIESPKREEYSINNEEVIKKAEGIANDINFMQKLHDDMDYKEAYNFAVKLSKKIKNLRKTGLEKEGSHSVENLAFKALRNHGYLERLSTYRVLSYDKMMSVKTNKKLIKVKLNEEWVKFKED